MVPLAPGRDKQGRGSGSMLRVSDTGVRRPEVLRQVDFGRFWAASTVSQLGTAVTTLALQVLVVLNLHGSATDVGLLNGARWLPYLLLGLVVGALVDRRRRQPVLVVTDVGRAVLLAAIPLLWLVGRLDLPVLMGLMVVFGVLSLYNDAASQSFIPRLVPREDLLAANARLDQSMSVGQTSGPVLAGALVSALGAPLAVLLDAASYLASGLAIASIRREEPAPDPGRPLPHLRREIGEGLRWVYHHRMLAPQAIGTHGWFICHAVVTTAFVPFALLGLHLSAFELGVTMACAGVGALVGALLAMRTGLRYGAGRTVVAVHFIYPVAWGVIALAPTTDVAAVVVVGLGQLAYGIGMGLSGSNEMAFRQSVTPDALQGRMNTTMRSINRAMIVIGAPLGGFLADAIGYRPVLLLAIVGFAVVAVGMALSPFRDARIELEP